MNGMANRTIRRCDYLPPNYRVETVELTFTLGEETTLVASRLHLQRTAQASGTTLTLLGRHLELLSLRRDGSPLAPASLSSATRRVWSSPIARRPSPSRSRRRSTRRKIPPSKVFICRAVGSAPSAKPKASAVSPTSLTAPMSSPAIPSPSSPTASAIRSSSVTAIFLPAANSPAGSTLPAGSTPSLNLLISSPWSPATWLPSPIATSPAVAGVSICVSTPRPTTSTNALTPWPASRRRWAGTKRSTASNTTSIST